MIVRFATTAEMGNVLIVVSIGIVVVVFNFTNPKTSVKVG